MASQLVINMTYTRDQLISALVAEYDYLCHDDYDPDTDMSPGEHLSYLVSLSLDDLIAETATDDEFTLDDFMSRYLWSLHRGINSPSL